MKQNYQTCKKQIYSVLNHYGFAVNKKALYKYLLDYTDLLELRFSNTSANEFNRLSWKEIYNRLT